MAKPRQLELPLGDDAARVAALKKAGLNLTVIQDGKESWVASVYESNPVLGRHLTYLFKLTIPVLVS